MYDQTFNYTCKDSLLILHHTRALHSCCFDKIEFTPVLSDDTLRILEKEIIKGEPCNCVCNYDIVLKVAGMCNGTYKVLFCNANGKIVHGTLKNVAIP